MSLVDTIRQWDEGVAAAAKKDWAAALRVFSEIGEKNSKIFFNIGCLHLSYEDLNAAEKAFDNSICKDEHLAVAFFQRGITFYKKQKFEESLSDFKKAFSELRGNQLIDYKLLGLRYKLYGCEVLHNVALVHAQLGEWEKAEENLHMALNLKTEAKHSHIDRALDSILKQKLFSLVEVTVGELFRPNKQHVAELDKKDYLGKAKVVASIIPKDEFSGFAPLQPQVEEAPSRPKAPEVLRALEGEPHRVLYEFLAETPDELPVVPGNIVFVLMKGVDNWATVVFNGKRGLVPYNFLDPVVLTLTSKQGQEGNQAEDIPAPPRGEPPVRPVRMTVLEPSIPGLPKKKTDKQLERERGRKICIVKVHFTYTMALSLEPGLPYSVVLDRVCKKLNQPTGTISLSYKKNGTDKVTLDASEMENAWRDVQNGRLTLWCESIENKENMPEEDNPQVVALYSYEASQPEDLEFKAGDVIKILTKVTEDWYEGECKGNVGLFPAAFVKQYAIEDRVI
ncbi:neutrophil cytosol factor 2 isoform X2 [Amia ocellicauda]|uniref:neutrophil cytosol factor 2 isoform X2 n=1 Tax=Amia ocellicauda TaxID=2972642 RepID=UPI00346486CE